MTPIRRLKTSETQFRMAEDLDVIFDFAIDDSKDCKHRVDQVLQIMRQMMTLAHKRGRPSLKAGANDEAA